jgi:hypothetical protein
MPERILFLKEFCLFPERILFLKEFCLFPAPEGILVSSGRDS